MALEAAAYDAAKVNPSCLQLNSTVLPQAIFRRTPVESFELVLRQLLPLILLPESEGSFNLFGFVIFINLNFLQTHNSSFQSYNT